MKKNKIINSIFALLTLTVHESLLLFTHMKSSHNMHMTYTVLYFRVHSRRQSISRQSPHSAIYFSVWSFMSMETCSLDATYAGWLVCHRWLCLAQACPYLCVSKFVLAVVDVEGGQELLCSFPAVHKLIIRNGMGVQDAVAKWIEKRVFQYRLSHWYQYAKRVIWTQYVPLFEFSVEDAVRKALSADPDALQHAVAAKLVQHQEWIHNPCIEHIITHTHTGLVPLASLPVT